MPSTSTSTIQQQSSLDADRLRQQQEFPGKAWVALKKIMYRLVLAGHFNMPSAVGLNGSKRPISCQPLMYIRRDVSGSLLIVSRIDFVVINVVCPFWGALMRESQSGRGRTAVENCFVLLADSKMCSALLPCTPQLLRPSASTCPCRTFAEHAKTIELALLAELSLGLTRILN